MQAACRRGGGGNVAAPTQPLPRGQVGHGVARMGRNERPWHGPSCHRQTRARHVSSLHFGQNDSSPLLPPLQGTGRIHIHPPAHPNTPPANCPTACTPTAQPPTSWTSSSASFRNRPSASLSPAGCFGPPLPPLPQACPLPLAWAWALTPLLPSPPCTCCCCCCSASSMSTPSCGQGPAAYTLVRYGTRVRPGSRPRSTPARHLCCAARAARLRPGRVAMCVWHSAQPAKCPAA